ncbi:MAG: hypothetical protein QOF17_675 [Solirubrobacteraceae bacterium]|nr:hypothetical protein [Solirubrobacteraceae bacterium]
MSAPGVVALAPELERWREELARVRPQYYRLVLDWAHLQPAAAAPANLDLPEAGCSRAVQPCAPYAGVRDQLRALASRQREGGWQGLVTITDTPPWAAAPASGCADGGGGARSGDLRPEALPAYRALVASVLAAARDAGAQLRWWSPWNEPNHPYFLPQREACDAASPSRAPAAYARIAAALREALAAAPGDQRLALGEQAGLLEPTARGTAVGEFIAALPRELVCAADVWTQHAYVGGSDPVNAVARALRARGCPGGVPPIWITETGVGAVDSRLALARGITSERQGCRMVHARLAQWWRDPRVAAAFQYEFREDEAFPTGLVDPALTRPRRVLAEWQAWGARERPDAPPPPSACG